MCFSAPVSFTAAAFLTLAGSKTLKQIQSSNQIFFALIPFLFATQQFFEGILWLHLPENAPLEGLSLFASYVFLAFAMLFWPVWIPLSILFLEKEKWRQAILVGFLLAGIAWSSFFIWLFPTVNIQIGIIGNSIQYYADVPISKFYYISLILSCCFISSFPKIWYFGVLIGLSIIVTDYFYEATFVSVWCFFSALMSFAIYHILKKQPLVD